ncbi:MAG: hypothetical protein UW81_C0010G0021 [Candidatus Giovannonibacteria bacterium GW2011_GWC2_44_9]|uniref:Uncharacterized protein n=3 Tax=Candidatus Giovannoniibacteriota TaxID=1752738 RepID=A0A0G1L3F5_9BACT|nr:MAG: hypothetical protein UW49_C0016G0010 [Candidatus Giovannonibacteria bacterium GW2011_GWB1_44_23]KKT63122.1 MAG: hypothetical protein UW57_C0010G0011 [Candidatus Giovannonibacteria bacterium GW2011_GWA1_44_29]KKT83832.1 MAG: hypothetical protein UW81_C0010G0021 [Candidatus Giovannonibacteria bacterium GW2011_GWC2_44_9]KKT91342.1 MAG: hypothetical protein UW93_C0008G0021 [Parcubacteria group bacterium GW2011_GWC1_45_13]HBB54081.1 hypothetical protein [Candidatus Nomurabacteria bacterium]
MYLAQAIGSKPIKILVIAISTSGSFVPRPRIDSRYAQRVIPIALPGKTARGFFYLTSETRFAKIGL